MTRSAVRTLVLTLALGALLLAVWALMPGVAYPVKP